MPVIATYKPLFQEVISDVELSVYTAGGEAIGKIHICNFKNPDCWFSLKIGGTGSANLIFDEMIIPGHGTFDWDVPFTLEVGDQIYALAQTTNSLVISGWGVEQT